MIRGWSLADGREGKFLYLPIRGKRKEADVRSGEGRVGLPLPRVQVGEEVGVLAGGHLDVREAVQEEQQGVLLRDGGRNLLDALGNVSHQSCPVLALFHLAMVEVITAREI
ncbi:MAG: hypothetical protein AN484_15390 [Aphanizomenon flos-aquae WA102]|uniref:Uncharacterized protein n=1 Tax=Aphanizomenon flos-aquae WA102 TaxID=1710896 RepID=A0A1B7X0J0_APHFL|nr:MAG: hypothetical protein AN484_15390 [Aphanizomenon flos-aquae WA102]